MNHLYGNIHWLKKWFFFEYTLASFFIIKEIKNVKIVSMVA